MKKLMTLAMTLSVLSPSSLALAQGAGKPAMRAETGGGGPYRSFAIAIPLVSIDGEASGRMEFNLMGEGSLAIEVCGQRAEEQISEEKTLETKESLIAGGKGASLIVARYTQPASMSGFYWALGAGVREEKAEWRVQPSEKDTFAKSLPTDKDGVLNHRASLKGGTAHARLGYRYSGTSYPFMIGGYIGARHFQASVKDLEPATEDKDITVSAMTEYEKEKLKRRAGTSSESTIEFGVMF